MRLIPGSSNLESADPVIPVRWCIDRAESEVLKQREAENIHIFFVIAYEGTYLEDRLLVPIDRMMAYLNFRRPGKHIVLAKVVWGKDVAKLKEYFLSRQRRQWYSSNYLNRGRTAFCDDSFFDEGEYCRTLRGAAELEVVVPKEHFPKEPPAWLSRLVNMGFDYPPVDQCDFRERMLLAPFRLILATILAVLIMTVRTIGAVFLSLLLGFRINLRAFFHPWHAALPDIFDDMSIHNSWVLHKEENEPRSRWFILCHPLPLTLLFIVLTIVKHHYHVTYLMALAIVGHALIVAVKAVAKALLHFFSKIWTIILGAALLFGAIVLTQRQLRKARAKKLELEGTVEFRQRRRQAKLESYDKLYELVGCSTTPIVPALSALPPERRTLVLRYQKLKARVCRPYAAS